MRKKYKDRIYLDSNTVLVMLKEHYAKELDIDPKCIEVDWEYTESYGCCNCSRPLESAIITIFEPKKKDQK